MNSALQIQPIGEYFQNDIDGFVINPASWNKIPVKWHPVIDRIKESYLEHLGNKIHSIYLRGSLVRGFAVEGFSDLDSFAIVKENGLRWKDAWWTTEINTSLTKKYPFVKEVELMLSAVDDNNILENSNISMIIKTQSICIFGEGLGPNISKYKPGNSMMLNYRWIEDDFEDLIGMATITDDAMSNFLKKLIRTGFELVMEKEGKYTPDLYLCCKSFGKHFPEWKLGMENALYCYLNPSRIDEETFSSLTKLSKWMIEKVKLHLL